MLLFDTLHCSFNNLLTVARYSLSYVINCIMENGSRLIAAMLLTRKWKLFQIMHFLKVRCWLPQLTVPLVNIEAVKQWKMILVECCIGYSHTIRTVPIGRHVEVEMIDQVVTAQKSSRDVPSFRLQGRYGMGCGRLG
jgi:hypothetical protein